MNLPDFRIIADPYMYRARIKFIADWLYLTRHRLKRCRKYDNRAGSSLRISFLSLSLSFIDRLEEALLLALLIFTVDSPERRISISSTRTIACVANNERSEKHQTIISELHIGKLYRVFDDEKTRKNGNDSDEGRADLLKAVRLLFRFSSRSSSFAISKSYSTRL